MPLTSNGTSLSQVLVSLECEYLTSLEHTGTGIAPSREVHGNTVKVLTKFASDKVPEVRVRVAECLAAVASCSAGFNTISVVPMLTLCLKHLGDEFPRVRLAFAVTTGTLVLSISFSLVLRTYVYQRTNINRHVDCNVRVFGFTNARQFLGLTESIEKQDVLVG